MKYGHSYCVEACCLNQPLLKLRNAPAKYRHYWAYAWFWLALMTCSSLTAIIQILKKKQKSLRDNFVPPHSLSVCKCLLPMKDVFVCFMKLHSLVLFFGRKPNSIHLHEIRAEEAESRWISQNLGTLNHNSQCALWRLGWINALTT